MGYVKAGIIKEGRLTVVEVHKNELFLSCKERMKNEKRRFGADLSLGVNSGITEERRALGIDELDTEEKIDRWIAYLEGNHCPGYAGNEEGQPLNCIVDFDVKLFISIKNNWYADYQEGLTNDWVYQEVSVESMEGHLSQYLGELEYEGCAVH